MSLRPIVLQSMHKRPSIFAARLVLKTFYCEGDTGFSMSQHLDKFNEQGVRFIFGYMAHSSFKAFASSMGQKEYERLVRKTEEVKRANAEHVLSKSRKILLKSESMRTSKPRVRVYQSFTINLKKQKGLIEWSF